MPSVGGDLSKTVCPIVPAPHKDFDRRVPEMDLDPIAVELYLMQPSLAARHALNCGGERGGMKPGNGAFKPTERRAALLIVDSKG